MQSVLDVKTEEEVSRFVLVVAFSIARQQLALILLQKLIEKTHSTNIINMNI